MDPSAIVADLIAAIICALVIAGARIISILTLFSPTRMPAFLRRLGTGTASISKALPSAAREVSWADGLGTPSPRDPLPHGEDPEAAQGRTARLLGTTAMPRSTLALGAREGAESDEDAGT